MQRRQAREAGDSIKPGAQAPGTQYKKARKPVKRATARMVISCRPFHGLQTLICFTDPGACAPGFMLSPASRAETVGSLSGAHLIGLTEDNDDVFDEVMNCGEDLGAALDGHSGHNKQGEDEPGDESND